MFAVFEAKGFQYLGSPGEKLKIPRLDSEIGEKVTFDKVLLVKNGDTKIGQPYIEGASIAAKIVDHGRYKKIIVFKFKKRNRYKRTRGHRQTYTEIEIKDIILGGKAETKKVSKKDEVKAEKKPVVKAEIKKATAEEKKATSKAKKKTTAAKKTTKKIAKPKKETTKKKKTAAKPKKSSAKAKKTTSKTKKEKK
ncbi:50S ribosomal protein L21 [candidate division WOR-3 bacterium]|nr:50S ribosomal protein L21 [candidate division WOR-3 bacterium]